ncbi:MAG: translation elongation factor Ts [Alphaproteobacteria bacterium]
MLQISAAQVKALRDKTGAGMMDCKKALLENAGEMEAAVDWLRKKGLAAAAKKAGRIAADGLVGVAVDERRAAVVEVNAETDFVARNAAFQEAVHTVATVALDTGDDIEALKSASYPGSEATVNERLTELVASIGENIQLRRAAALSVGEGVVASYVHGAIAPGLGRIGVLVAIESSGDADKLAALGKQLAMHVAAARPEALTVDDVDSAALERERSVLREQARATGKPEEVVAKMVEGRLRKYYEQVVLLEQTFVIDGKTKVSKALAEAVKDAGAPVRVSGFVRFALGEGIEKEAADFAAEVASQLAG